MILEENKINKFKENTHKYVLHCDWLVASINDTRVSHNEVTR